MPRKLTIWLSVGAYLAAASGALLTLHMAEHVASAAAKAATCCGAHPAPGESHSSSEPSAPDTHRDCRLCEAVAELAKITPPVAAVALPELMVTPRAVVRIADLRPLSTICFDIIPRGPPAG